MTYEEMQAQYLDHLTTKSYTPIREVFVMNAITTAVGKNWVFYVPRESFKEGKFIAKKKIYVRGEWTRHDYESYEEYREDVKKLFGLEVPEDEKYRHSEEDDLEDEVTRK